MELSYEMYLALMNKNYSEVLLFLRERGDIMPEDNAMALDWLYLHILDMTQISLGQRKEIRDDLVTRGVINVKERPLTIAEKLWVKGITAKVFTGGIKTLLECDAKIIYMLFEQEGLLITRCFKKDAEDAARILGIDQVHTSVRNRRLVLSNGREIHYLVQDRADVEIDGNQSAIFSMRFSV